MVIGMMDNGGSMVGCCDGQICYGSQSLLVVVMWWPESVIDGQSLLVISLL